MFRELVVERIFGKSESTPTKIHESLPEVDNCCSLIIILQARHSITQFLQTDSQTTLLRLHLSINTRT